MLKLGISRSFGRNFLGRTTIFGKGMLSRIRYNMINFFYKDISCVILGVVKDYYRNSFIGLVLYKNGFLTFILLENSSKVGDIINKPNNFNKNKNYLLKGNSFYLKFIPLNFKVFGLEKYPNSNIVYTRSAGNFSILVSKFEK
jgi:ribosomal protein L2